MITKGEIMKKVKYHDTCLEKEINGHLYITNDNLKRIADALEEILRLVKKDMEPRTKEKK